MPRYYCDYCDTYLTHDSPSVRKQHNQGYKHKANVRSYYQQFEEQQTQSLIDQKVREHLGQTAAFQQHLSAGYVYRPPLSAPVLRPPSLPHHGANPSATGSPLLPTLRPPIMPRPSGTTSSGYTPTTTFRPPFGVTAQGNGLTPPSALIPPGATGVIRPVSALTSTTANDTPSSSGPLGVYQQSSIASVASFGSYNSTATGIGSGGYSISRPPATAISGNFPHDQNPQATLSASSSYGAASASLSPGYRS